MAAAIIVYNTGDIWPYGLVFFFFFSVFSMKGVGGQWLNEAVSEFKFHSENVLVQFITNYHPFETHRSFQHITLLICSIG